MRRSDYTDGREKSPGENQGKKMERVRRRSSIERHFRRGREQLRAGEGDEPWEWGCRGKRKSPYR